MARLFILVEGETEETFVTEVLAPHLYAKGLEGVAAKIMGNARLRKQRGGVRGWPEVRRDIIRHLITDGNVVLTMMVDYYGMPSNPTKNDAWPGRAEASALTYSKKADCVEKAIVANLKPEFGQKWDERRFIPFVVMHEFEGLLFSDCHRFAQGIGRPALAPEFQAIRKRFKSPEEINDSPETHPSQRVLDLVPEYRKPIFGNIAALEIGFEPIRAECPHFNGWLTRLEHLA